MLSFFRYIFGYLVVEISGECIEGLLNIAAKNRIVFWDLSYSKGKITGKIGIKNFKKLRMHRKKGIHKIKIIRRCGLPFFLAKNSKRLGFFTGFIIFCSILLFLSNFIWCIEVSGNKGISDKDIIRSAAELKIDIGCYKKSISPENTAQRFLLLDNRFAWCAFNVEGCVLNINVTEAKNKNNSKKAANIIAAENGVIKKIDVTAGTVVCKVGDIVNKGELLVSGVEESAQSTNFVKAKGKIIAEVQREFVKEGNFSVRRKYENGDLNKQTVFEFFGLKVPLFIGKIKGEFKTEATATSLKLWGKKMPIGFITKNYRMQTTENITRDKEKLKNILNKEIINELKSSKAEDFIKISENTIEEEKGLSVCAVYALTQDIAQEDIILIDTKN